MSRQTFFTSRSESTRDCLDPWFFALLNSRGGLQPCCWHPPVGTLSKDVTLDDLLNGDAMRELRRQLLVGELNEHCAACPSRSLIDPATFQQKVREELQAVRGQARGVVVKLPSDDIAGYVDHPQYLVRGRPTLINGWIFSRSRAIRGLELRHATGWTMTLPRDVPRPDVEADHPRTPHAVRSGFRQTVECGEQAGTLQLIATFEDGSSEPAFEIPLVEETK